MRISPLQSAAIARGVILLTLAVARPVSLAPTALPGNRATPAEPTEPLLQTFSICAYDPVSKQWGLAVASWRICVGALVPWGKANAGVMAAQAHADLNHGPVDLKLLSEGMSAQTVLNADFRRGAFGDNVRGVVGPTGRKLWGTRKLRLAVSSKLSPVFPRSARSRRGQNPAASACGWQQSPFFPAHNGLRPA